ncbi:MAG: FecR domain-containing protein [Polyangiaceae bacterium]|nr:FecR domain-containing protein [Polyangiaceae bacterium]
MTDAAERVGELVRRWVRTDIGRASLASLRARVVAEATRTRRPVAPWVAGAVGAAALAVTIVLFVRHPAPSQATVSFWVGAEQQAGALGTYYQAPPTNQALQLKFSDGSEVKLAPGGGGRVTNLRPHGATVLLEVGRATVNVQPRLHAEWRIAAGPYTVEVVGTRFEMGWKVDCGTLDVEMQHGAVVVRGPGIETGVRLRQGDRFVSQTSNRLLRPANAVTEPQVQESSDSEFAGTAGSGGEEPGYESEESRGEESVAPVQHEPHVRSRASLSGASSEPAPTLRSSWREMAARGDYAAVVEQAENDGLDNVLSTADITDLGVLADAARYTGRPDLAEQTLMRLRERFSGSSRAISAAFVLGRMRDDAHQSAAALSWYETYLREAPAGPLAAEALGRKMLAVNALGQYDAAVETAREYLRRFPTGAYSRHARQLVAY